MVESLWQFSIPDRGISLPVLLVGSVSEPSLALDRIYVNFNSVLLGRRAQETVHLVNNEDIAFSFAIDPTTYQAPPGAGGKGKSKAILEIEPTSGVVGPRQQIPLVLSFRPNMVPCAV